MSRFEKGGITLPPEALPSVAAGVTAEVVVCRGLPDCPVQRGEDCQKCLTINADDYANE